jgi:predicted dehydrogenase
VIGFGYWGPNLVRNFNDLPDCKIISVSDKRSTRLEKAHSTYPIIKTTTNHLDLLSDPDVHAVAIATPVTSHYELVNQALEHGKHVLVEKPLAATSEQAERLIEKADRQGLVLMVDHTFIYTGAVRKIRELVSTNALGQLYYYDSVRVNLGLFQHDVNVIWDLAVHDISILDHVIPSVPRLISATGVSHVSGQPEDIAFLTLFFDGKLIAHIHVNWLAPVKVRRTLIGGERKMIVYDDLEPSEKVKIYDKGISVSNDDSLYRILIDYRTGDMWAPQTDRTEALRNEASHFVKCIETGGSPETDGKSGLRVVRILEAATQSLGLQGKPVELSL